MIRNKHIKVRAAKVKDYLQCLPLLKSLYHGDVGPDFKEIFENFVHNKDSAVLLAEHRHKIVGILTGSYHFDIDWEGKVAKIDALIVDEPLRNMGIGRKLVRNFIVIAKRQNCKAVRSRVNKKNRVAQKFHEHLGFKRAKTYEYILDFQEVT